LFIIKFWEDEEIQKKVKSVVLEELKKHDINPDNNNKDKFVIELLNWYKHKFFTWCNSPKCRECKKETTINGSDSPTEEEEKWACQHVEIHKCKNNHLTRFARYNNPMKLIETRTGRCGEWANLFGCILRTFGFRVRLVENFEDHVWNEYYSESLKRVFY
jgi:peptide-N4-(N-acetyl-beta-glucosaminyl)asparagine amidase